MVSYQGDHMSNRLLTLSTLAGAFLLASCGQPGKVTGGGTMNSAGGAGKAVFTFHADSCTEGTVKGSMNLHDSSAIEFEALNGVKLKADVTDTYFCVGDIEDFDAPLCACSDGFQEVLFDYVSTNPKADGQGDGIACLADFGEKGAGIHGASIISIASGPFGGYYNVGTIHGNVQQHECPNG